MSAIPMDPRVAQIARMFDHLVWADGELGRAVARSNAPADAIREYAHIAGTSEVWLSRIEHRTPAAAIWPELNPSAAASLVKKTGATYKTLVNQLNDASLDAPIKYTNSAGKTFATPLGDILLHVAMHAQYHRGKVNQMLRQAAADPAPVDFITFARGVPAATQATAK